MLASLLCFHRSLIKRFFLQPSGFQMSPRLFCPLVAKFLSRYAAFHDMRPRVPFLLSHTHPERSTRPEGIKMQLLCKGQMHTCLVKAKENSTSEQQTAAEKVQSTPICSKATVLQASSGPYTGGAGGPRPPRNLRSRFLHKGDPYDFGEILRFGGLGPPVVENWALPPPSLNPVYGPGPHLIQDAPGEKCRKLLTVNMASGMLYGRVNSDVMRRTPGSVC